MAILTSLTQIFQVQGITQDLTYNASVFGYSLALLALGRAEASWVVLISFIAIWAWRKGAMPWFALGFNIGSATIPLALASLVYQFITNHYSLHSLQGVVGIIAVGAVYIFVSQLMTGLVFWLVDGKSLTESGLLDRILVIIDATQFAMGSLAALVWTINPYAVIFALSPIYLTHLALQLPSLQLKAETDSKTGLYNARYFNNALEKELVRAERADHPLSVVMGDMDLLRKINNTYGHLAGDKALITVANTIKKLVRNYDIVARFGGEEFAVIMPETTVDRAMARMEEIRLAIESTVIELQTNTTSFHVTMSFGIAGREAMGQKPTEIIHNADVALYQAKKHGRNKVYCYTTEGPEQKIDPVIDR